MTNQTGEHNQVQVEQVSEITWDQLAKWALSNDPKINQVIATEEGYNHVLQLLEDNKHKIAGFLAVHKLMGKVAGDRFQKVISEIKSNKL